MIIINEFFPNPIGKDADGEFIELFNSGGEPISLSGWKIKDSSNKTFTFVNQKIEPGEYLVLDYKTTKISLNNNGEKLFLYDGYGNLIDGAEYTGTAEAGKSLIRKDNHFVFTDKPTSGKVNVFETAEVKNSASSLSKNYGSKSSINNAIATFPSINNNAFNIGNLTIGLALALILSIVFVMIYKKINLD